MLFLGHQEGHTVNETDAAAPAVAAVRPEGVLLRHYRLRVFLGPFLGFFRRVAHA
jgi:hypothetical protein